eukprot:5071195-Amphidinium_carterae.1
MRQRQRRYAKPDCLTRSLPLSRIMRGTVIGPHLWRSPDNSCVNSAQMRASASRPSGMSSIEVSCPGLENSLP